jgi:hypothetical protein
MSKIQPKTTSYEAPGEFLATDDYQLIPGGVTVDSGTVTSAGDGSKVLKSGELMGKVTASGKFGPYDSGVSDGREVFVGHLFYEVDVTEGDDLGSVMIVGVVKEAALPTAPTSTTKGHNPAIRYV